MEVIGIASVCVITDHPEVELPVFLETLGLPLEAPTTVPGSAYRYSEHIPGAAHFGVWPLTEAAQACFGTPTWPADRPVPQATIELEVTDVAAAAAELQAAGQALVHPVRTEPWGQVLARFQLADGLLLAVCRTPCSPFSPAGTPAPAPTR